MLKKLLCLLLVFALTAAVLVGFDTVEAAAGTHPLEAMDEVLARFPRYIDTGKEHVPGTTFRYAIGSPSPWAGMFGGGVFHDSTVDAEVVNLINSSLLATNEFYQFGQHGVCTWEHDMEARTLTLTMQYDVFWHDGEPLTMNDLVYAYEVIIHPDYTGPRFNADARNVVGWEAYREGEADHIEGLVLSNDNKTLTMHFYEMSPSMLYFGPWTTPMPRHIFEGIPVAEMAESDAVRVNPIGWGPWIVENIVPGESVAFRRNENFVFGAPLIEHLVVERINSDFIPTAMEEGLFDFVFIFPTAYYEDYQNPTNYTYLGRPTGDYDYIAFRLGHWNDELGKNVYAPTRKMANVNLRRAMGFAVDEAELTETLFFGLRFPAASNMPPHHRALIDTSVPGFPYNPEEANRLLDEAGYIDIDGCGFRECPEGEKFVINFAFRQGPMEDVIVPFYIQSWAAVGLNVELWQGRTHEVLFLWDMLDFDADNDEIDIYHGGWSPGANPSPDGSWGHIWWNPSRYTSPEYDAIIDRIGSEATWDEAYMLDAYSAWQWYWYNNAPYYTTQWRISLRAVNNRVTNWDTRIEFEPLEFYNSEYGWHKIGLSADAPIR
ncbi:MAG: ABC transporter substrate-binding protein [Defluviitaleaceae bacterium]|nr:ABC transporter substrate-binding protein [Defluviitaleaceae bacterium]MCL2835839.1 ABC transporter substrate-binding protein [Defluviitaleaceae bacterium]